MPAKKATKKAAEKPTRAAPKAATVSRTTRSTAKPTPAPQPSPGADDHDYLVIYEEPDPDGLPADDVLVLDIESPSQSRGEVDVQQKLDVGLTNTTSRLGTFGFVITVLGALLGVGLLVAFSMIYPDDWYGSTSSTNAVRATIILATMTLVLLVGGTILTHYGRRIQAKTTLRDVRIIEKSPQNRLQFE